MTNKGLVVLCLLVTLLQVRAQVACYPNHLCGTDGNMPVSANSSSGCCLQTLAVTKSYAPSDGSSACQPCIVIGFNTREMEISENFLDERDIEVEVLTADPDFSTYDGVRFGTLSFTVGLNPLSSATFGEDFIFGNSRETTQSYTSMINNLPVSVSVEILPDLIPGEEESFVLELADVALTNLSSGEKLDVIVAVNSVTVVIVDDDVLEVNFKDHEFSADESAGKMDISFVISNPIISTTHFFVVPMTYKDYDDQFSALSAAYPRLDHFTLPDEYDQAESTDFVQEKLAFSVLANTTEPNQTVTITFNDDKLLEPVEEGFRLVLMVDESKTNRSLVSFGRQLALFRIDDREDSISFGFVNAVQYQDDINGTHVVQLRVNITRGATEMPFNLRFFFDQRSDAEAGVDYNDATTGMVEIQPPNILPQDSFFIEIRGDDVVEGDERVVVSFSRPLGLQLPEPFKSERLDNPPNSDITAPPDHNIDVYRDSTTIVIREVIPQVTVSLTVPEVVREGETFFPRLTVSHKVNATFGVQSSDGTAERMTDYPYFLEAVEFVSPSLSRFTDSPVSVEMDRLVEPNETFYISVFLSGTSPPQDKVMIINPKIQITIIDTNSATIVLENVTDPVYEYDEEVNVTVAVEGDPLADNAVIEARLYSSSGTATPGADFEPFEKNLTFTGGIQKLEVPVPFFNDEEPEEDETIKINLEVLSSNIDFVPLERSLIRVEIIDDDLPLVIGKVCTLSSNLILQTFSNQLETGHSIDISAGCERKLVTSCDPDVDLEIRVDFFQDDFASTKVAILYNEMLVIIDEDLNLIPPTAPSSAFDYVTDMNMVSVAIPRIMLTVTRNRTELTISADNTTLGLVGLCGDLDGQLFYPDCTTPYGMAEALESLMNSYKLKPADQVLRGEREECGITTNDTVIGDPLMTVPIHVPDHLPEFDSGLNLCYEIHGAEDKYFNLVSDGCTSVNAHYARASVETTLNIIDSMSIVAVDNQGKCHNITVDATSGDATVDTNSETQRRAISKRSHVFNVLDEEGISVRSYQSRVRISVPNCEDNALVMWVIFQNQPLYDPFTNTTTEPVNMIKFEITRGLNLKERSHGLLGQFWNIPITVTPYNGTLVYPEHSQEKFYTVEVKHPSSAARKFVGFIHDVTWEWKRKHCLYVGDQQGGPAGEVRNDGPVIQGSYEDYITDTKYGTEFKYDAFTHVCYP